MYNYEIYSSIWDIINRYKWTKTYLEALEMRKLYEDTTESGIASKLYVSQIVRKAEDQINALEDILNTVIEILDENDIKNIYGVNANENERYVITLNKLKEILESNGENNEKVKLFAKDNLVEIPREHLNVIIGNIDFYNTEKCEYEIPKKFKIREINEEKKIIELEVNLGVWVNTI